MKVGKISKQKLYTVEELLKKNPPTPALKRQFDKIEEEYGKMYGKKEVIKKNVEVTAKQIVDAICKSKNITSYFDNNHYVLKDKKRAKCLVADRKNWVSVSTWDKGGKNFITIRIKTKKEMNEIIKKTKAKFRGEKNERKQKV